MMICVVAIIYGCFWTGFMYHDDLCCGNNLWMLVDWFHVL